MHFDAKVWKGPRNTFIIFPNSTLPLRVRQITGTPLARLPGGKSMMHVTPRVLPVLFALLSTLPTYGQMIVAHRGSSHEAPENTLAAFELAWQQGADAIEGDFYLTQDGEIVCLHDKTTARTAPKHPELKVATSTLEQLRQVDVGSWKHARYAGEKIPTLQEVLATIPENKGIFVEVKCGPEITPVLKKQLEQSRLKPEQITIICFNADVVKACRSEMPQYKANWLTSYKQRKPTGIWTPEPAEVLNRIKTSGATGLGTQGNAEVIDAPFAEAILQAGHELHVWTINDSNQARYFADLGAKSITTDKPLEIRQALAPATTSERP
jgi:glycerophosphoryl diester phosphodiesterase